MAGQAFLCELKFDFAIKPDGLVPSEEASICQVVRRAHALDHLGPLALALHGDPEQARGDGLYAILLSVGQKQPSRLGASP